MARELFHRELVDLQDAVLVLGSMTEKAILDSMEALRDGDRRWSQMLIDDDRRINAKRFEIEEKCVLVMGTQQPMAGDLRNLVSMLFIITDLERMADHAEGIARINLLLGEEPLPRRLGYIPAMADRAIAMLRNTLKAYTEADIALARQVSEADDEVDRLQDSVYDDCTAAMVADASSIQRNTYMLWTSHNLERIADRCTNICERVIFMVTGKMEEINVSTY
ncbi:MAG: phosphate signaling complex protein PhoU [Dehalococcoidia bacterium]